MKSIKIILLIVSMSLVSCNSSKKMNFYETALIKAGEQTKYILLDFGASWCGGCRAFDKYVFDDSRTKSKLKEKFIVLKIDRDEPKNKYLVDKYKISGLPQIVIINKSEKILGGVAYFDARYLKEPDLFVVRLNYIIESQNKISKLEESFDSDSTNKAILNDLLREYQNIGDYIGVGKIKKLLVNIDPTPERIFEYHFDKAIKAIKDEKNPEPLLTILSTSDSLDIKHKAIANVQLLYYYKSINDVRNQDYFYRKLLRINPGYFKKEYARFLFEHNKKIDSAIILTREVLLDENYRNDHWGQFLKAHSLVCQGKKTKAVNEYNNWMKKIINRREREEYYWPLYFYARFANYYNVDLKRASDYLKIAEINRTLVDDKILLAEILYKLGETNLAIDKLTESLKYIDEKKEHERIVALIAQYKKQL